MRTKAAGAQQPHVGVAEGGRGAGGAQHTAHARRPPRTPGRNTARPGARLRRSRPPLLQSLPPPWAGGGTVTSRPGREGRRPRTSLPRRLRRRGGQAGAQRAADGGQRPGPRRWAARGGVRGPGLRRPRPMASPAPPAVDELPGAARRLYSRWAGRTGRRARDRRGARATRTKAAAAGAQRGGDAPSLRPAGRGGELGCRRGAAGSGCGGCWGRPPPARARGVGDQQRPAAGAWRGRAGGWAGLLPTRPSTPGRGNRWLLPAVWPPGTAGWGGGCQELPAQPGTNPPLHPPARSGARLCPKPGSSGWHWVEAAEPATRGVCAASKDTCLQADAWVMARPGLCAPCPSGMAGWPCPGLRACLVTPGLSRAFHRAMPWCVPNPRRGAGLCQPVQCPDQWGRHACWAGPILGGSSQGQAWLPV